MTMSARHRDRGVAVARPRVLDLGLDDAFDRVAVLADFARRGEGVVEVGADLRRGPGLGQGVADAALLDEEDAAALGVGAGRAAAGGDSDERRQGGEGEQRADEFGSLACGAERAGVYMSGPPESGLSRHGVG